MDTALIGLGVSLADVLSRNTVDYVGDKIRLAKEKKDLQSRSVASEDIEYLQKTLRGAVKILFAFSPQTDEVKLSIDTLIESRATGSTFKEISGTAMKNFPIIIPTKLIIDDFSKTVNPIFHKIDYIEKEVRSLEKVRNILLPKLLSGEIEV